MEGAEHTNRSNSTCFVRIDVDKLYEHIPAQHIFQSANGTVLVRDVVPVSCFKEIVYQNGPGDYQVVWSAARVGQAPSVVVPSAGGMRDYSGGAVQAVRQWAGGSRTPAGPAAGGGGSRTPASDQPTVAISLDVDLDIAGRVTFHCPVCDTVCFAGACFCISCRSRFYYEDEAHRLQPMAAGVPVPKARPETLALLREARSEMGLGRTRSAGGNMWRDVKRGKKLAEEWHGPGWQNPETTERIKNHARKGGVPLTWSTGRCEPWTPTSEHSRPNSQITLTPRDFVYAVLSMMGGPHTEDPDSLPREAAAKRMSAITFINIVSVLGTDVLWEIMRDEAMSADAVFLGIYNTIRDIPQLEESVVRTLGMSVDREDFAFALNFTRREFAQWGAIVDPDKGRPARDAPDETSEAKAAALARGHAVTTAIGRARRATPPPKPAGPTEAKAARRSGSRTSTTPPAPKARPSGSPAPGTGSKGQSKGSGGKTSATPAHPPPRATQPEKGKGRGSQTSAAPAVPISQSTHKGKSTGRGGKASAEPASIPPWRQPSGKSTGRGSQTPARPEASSSSAKAGGKASERGGRTSTPPTARPPATASKSGGKGSGSTPPPPPWASSRGGQQQQQRVWVPKGSAAVPASSEMPPPPPRTTIPVSSTPAGQAPSTGTPTKSKGSTPPTLRGSVARDPLITQDPPSQSRLPEARGSRTSTGSGRDDETGRARETRAEERRSSPRSRSGTGATRSEARPPSAPTASSRGEERRHESSGQSRPSEHRSRSQHGESSTSRQPSRRSPYPRDSGGRRSSHDDEPRRGRHRSPISKGIGASPPPISLSTRIPGGTRRRRDEDPRERGSRTSAAPQGDRPAPSAASWLDRGRDSPTRGPGRGASAPSVAKAPPPPPPPERAASASSRHSHDSPYPRESRPHRADSPADDRTRSRRASGATQGGGRQTPAARRDPPTASERPEDRGSRTSARPQGSSSAAGEQGPSRARDSASHGDPSSTSRRWGADRRSG